jgi:GNAT superfamily N-acetyltransferase
MLERMAQDIEVRKAIAQRNAPASIRNEEQGLQGGMEISDVGGVPISLTDLLPVDLGASALMKGGAALAAKFAAAKAAGLSAVPLMAGTFIGKNAKTWDSITAAKAAEMKVSGHAGADTWAATHSGNPLNPPSMYDVPVDQQIVRPSDNGPAMSIVPGSAEQWAMKNKSFSPEGMRSQKIGDYTYHIEDVGGGDGIIHAVDSSGRKVGDTFFGEGDMPGFINGSVGVDPEFRRRGIASTMYKLAEDVSGKKIIPEVTHTDDATAFWNQPNRTFGTDIASSKSPYQQLVEDSRAKVKAIIPQRENLNADLLDKHLSGNPLTTEEMVQYELNGRAMEQGRGDINAANAQAQGADYAAYRGEFDTPAYHGRVIDDVIGNQIPQANRGGSVGHAYLTDDPNVSSAYALTTTPSNTLRNVNTAKEIDGYSPANYPLSVRKGSVLTDENDIYDVIPTGELSDNLSQYDSSLDYREFLTDSELKAASNKILDNFTPEYSGSSMNENLSRLFGFLEESPNYKPYLHNKFNTVMFNDHEAGGKTIVPFSQSNIRSRFASFDPLRKDSASLLAGTAAASTAPLLYDLATRNEDYQ